MASAAHNAPDSLDFTSKRNESVLAIHAFAIGLARRAGGYLRKENNRWRRLAKHRTSEEKGANAVDLVSESDLEVERMIHQSVRETYPDHQVRLIRSC